MGIIVIALIVVSCICLFSIVLNIVLFKKLKVMTDKAASTKKQLHYYNMSSYFYD